jgi:hypothetical protein
LSAAVMYAMGSSNGDIARAHGKSPQAVSNLFHQKFFQKRVTELMAANRRDIVDLFKAERFNTLDVLIEMRDNPETPAHTRALVCRELLDRSIGPSDATRGSFERGDEFGSGGRGRAS